jgi:hypothetical protein
MAEAVAATAAIVQFVDVAVRLSFYLSHLCSEVRNVPQRFHRLQIDLRQQIEVAQHINPRHLPDSATNVGSSTFDEFLLGYIALVDELCKTLEQLIPNKNDGIFRRGWSGFCSVKKKEEVLQMCDDLEQKKTTMWMWLSAANM